MIHIEDIHSLTDFQRNTKAHVQRLKETGRPQVLTVNGKAEVVVQDAKSYQHILSLIEGMKEEMTDPIRAHKSPKGVPGLI